MFTSLHGASVWEVIVIVMVMGVQAVVRGTVVVSVVVVVVVVILVIVVFGVLRRRGRRAHFKFEGAVQGAQGRGRPGARVFMSMAMAPVGMRHGGS